ncbi:MAG: hypothetical protein IJN85_04125, partial [Oscillospiraceae bacterium]|nr:hypothetical protein [Oscillospiraceae bacterium]
MLDIKKKIIAIMTICAMAVSMSACSDDGEDKGGKTAEDIKVATLTPEEATEMMQDQFKIEEFTQGYVGELGQDPQEAPVEQDPVEQDPQESQGGESPIVDENGSIVDNVDMEISAVDSNSGEGGNSDGGNIPEGGNNAAEGDVNADGNNNADSNEGGNSAVVESSGTKKIQQAFWMNLNGDFNFEGEFITATFKIKETTANCTYPITLELLDFANIKGVSIDDVSGID